MDLITAKEVVGKLKQGGTADISTAYFSKLVTTGVIPFHTIAGKKRKMFKYDEAKTALIESQDPSRDAQREAVALVKKQKEVDEKGQNIERINEHYKRINSFMGDIVKLSESEYKEMLLLDKESWEHEDINECYIEDMKTIGANLILEEVLDDYLYEIKQPNNMIQLDLLIKKILVYSMLDQDFLSLNLDKLHDKKGA